MIIIGTLLFSLSSCLVDSESDNISSDFEVSYIDMPKFRNIYFRNEGIFSDQCVYSVYSNNQIIAIKTYFLDDMEVLDKDSVAMFIINMEQYRRDPSKEKSSGLKGPIAKQKFDSIYNSYGITEEDWNTYDVD